MKYMVSLSKRSNGVKLRIFGDVIQTQGPWIGKCLVPKAKMKRYVIEINLTHMILLLL